MNWGYLGFVGFKNLEIVQLGLCSKTLRLYSWETDSGGFLEDSKKYSGGGGGGGLGETPGGAMEVVADEEGGGGLAVDGINLGTDPDNNGRKREAFELEVSRSHLNLV
uniref:Uncharacterized protein n=1 Tax=Fagus sylvatica TaxID=28930 RepID=A0A2N9EPD8_FAGSY